MRKLFGNIGSFIGAMLVFRLVYGAWPPFEGSFWAWLKSDTRAMWSLLASLVGIVIGGLLGQAIGMKYDDR